LTCSQGEVPYNTKRLLKHEIVYTNQKHLLYSIAKEYAVGSDLDKAAKLFVPLVLLRQATDWLVVTGLWRFY